MIKQARIIERSPKMLCAMRDFKALLVIALATLLLFSGLLLSKNSNFSRSPLRPIDCSINSTQIHPANVINSCVETPSKNNLIDILGHSLLNAWYRMRYWG